MGAEEAVAAVLRGFSTPSVSFDEQVRAEIVSTYSEQICRVFLDKYRTRISPTLCEFLDGVIDEGSGGLLYWDWTLGEIQLSLAEEAQEPEFLAAALALRACMIGYIGTWRASFTTPKTLRFEDKVITQVADLEVNSDEQSVSLKVRLGNNDLRYVDLASDQTDSTVLVLSGFSIDGAKKIPLINRRYAPDDMGRREQQRGAGLMEDVDRACVAGFERAAAVLRDFSPNYSVWVARVVNDVLVRIPTESRISSGSHSDAPGVVSISLGEPLPIVEMLVHESSHQYFHMVSRVGAVDTGEDQRRYYSPAMECERPLSRILIAFHAFANVLLAYREILAREPTLAQSQGDAYARLIDDVQTLSKPLIGNRALTAYGRALAEPLLESL